MSSFGPSPLAAAYPAWWLAEELRKMSAELCRRAGLPPIKLEFIPLPPEPHPDELAFRRAICAAPDDDTPRLAFADWVDEHGDPSRAAMIRAMVAKPGGTVRVNTPAPGNGPKWHVVSAGVQFPGLGSLCRRLAAPALSAGVVSVGIRRGFLCDVTCRWAEWAAGADHLLAREPVREVTLTEAAGFTAGRTFEADGRLLPAGTYEEYHVAGRPVFLGPRGDHAYAVGDILSARWPSGRAWHLPPEPPPEGYEFVRRTIPVGAVYGDAPGQLRRVTLAELEAERQMRAEAAAEVADDFFH